MGLSVAQEAAYALDFGLARADLKPAVQAEYDRQLEQRRSQPAWTEPDAVFPALGVQVRKGVVELHDLNRVELGPLAGAVAHLTDGSQAWSPGRAMFLPVGLTGLATKTKAAAFVIFPDGRYHETALNGNAAVREAQADAVKFNALAGARQPTAQPREDDPAAALRKLASLHDEGLLTDEEYAAKRAEVVARI